MLRTHTTQRGAGSTRRAQRAALLMTYTLWGMITDTLVSHRPCVILAGHKSTLCAQATWGARARVLPRGEPRARTELLPVSAQCSDINLLDVCISSAGAKGPFRFG